MARLTVLGGGGFRVPLVFGALLRDHGDPRVDEVVLHDVDQARLDVVAHVLAQQAAGVPDAPRVRTSTVLAEALEGADFVFSAVRVGGLEGRSRDEHTALDRGVDVIGHMLWLYAAKDYGTTPQPTGNLLQNPGFESGAVSWTGTSGPITNNSGRPARTGTWKAWLGGNGSTSTETVQQSVAIPATATSAARSSSASTSAAST